MAPERTCPHERDAVAWLQGELSPARASDFAAHLPQCAACTAFVGDARALLASVARTGGGGRAVPAGRRRLALAAAALLAATLGLVAAWPPSSSPSRGAGAPPSRSATALARLEAGQSPDGGWSAEGTGGLLAQEVGLHALALLALVRGQELAPSDERLQRIEVAACWLAERQGEGGDLGLPLAEGHFDHAVATLALLEGWRLTGRDDLRGAGERALAHLVGTQLPHGAWSPAAAPGPAAWSLGALLRADELGFAGLPRAIARSRAFLRTQGGLELAAESLWTPPFWRLAVGSEPHTPGDDGDVYAASLAVLTPR